MEDNFILVDTNILLYLYNDNEEIKNKSINKTNELKSKGSKLLVSEQIIREFLVAQSNIQKIAGKVDLAKLIEDTRYIYYNFSIIYPSANSLSQLFGLTLKYNLQGKKIHDANIIAVATENNVRKIFTNNFSDFSFAINEGFEIITLAD
jgi:predicted nucleic acid-binding protein